MEKKDSYWNPILAGFALGTVLFISFMVAAQGMGASGAFARAVAQLEFLYDPDIANNSYVAGYLKHGSALANWTVVEVVGIFLGGYISAAFAGRIKGEVDRGEDYPVYKRLIWAFLGGVIIAAATRLGRGCTSGQVLDGVTVYSVGSWIYMLAIAGTVFIVAPLFKKQWKGVK